MHAQQTAHRRLARIYLMHKELRSHAQAFEFSAFVRMLIYIIIKTKF